MKILDRNEDVHQFRDDILTLSGEDASSCVQCGKCTGSCPIALEMDLKPSQVLRHIQLNSRKTVLECSTIWLCASCETCSSRCPEKIEIATIMDTLRKMAIEEGLATGQKQVVDFDRIFLDSIKRHGRVHELGLVMRYNMASREPLKDVHLGPLMLGKGKISLLAHKIRERTTVKEIFRQSRRFLGK
ncbi:MAG: heterodisulfide reductase [Proteobacteria bacterium]|nr:heterodisulfide reductase [Pseudomonadota bacterium]NIS69624.1 heterodisulfide reductase [Pseudomonadota bacterium]